MSVSIKVNINAAAPKAALARIKAVAEDSEALHAGIAEAVARVTREHLRVHYVPRDERGIDFWADVVNSVEAESDASGATVSLNELGIGLRYRGGTVTPGKSISSYTGELTRALAIPGDKTPVQQGRAIRPGRAGVLAFIRAVSRGETIGYLVEGQEKTITRGKNKGGTRIVPKPGGSLLYTLRTITRHRPDPNILPDEAAIFWQAQAVVISAIFGES